MFRFISNFFNVFLAELRLTLREIGWSLGIVAVLTIIGVLPAFCGTPIKHSFYLSFPIWIFSAYRIFGIWRYLRIVVVGEVLDSFQAIGPETNQTIWDSELATTYRKVAINIWLGQTVIFLAAPLYFNLTSGGRLWLPVLIMVVFAIAMISVKAGLWLFRATAVVTIAIFSIVAVYDIFPQINQTPFVSEAVAKLKAGKEAGENARKIADIHALREKQRQEMVARVMDKARFWQEQNPGKVLPDEILQEMEAAKKGLSLEEYRGELKRAAEARAKAEAEAKERADAEAKAKALEKMRLEAEKQEAEKKRKEDEERKRSLAMGTEVVLEPVEDTGRRRKYKLPDSAEVGDSVVLKDAISSNGLLVIFVGNTNRGEYPKKVIPANLAIKIDEYCNKGKDGLFYLSFLSDYEIITNPKIVVYHKKGGA